MRIVLLLLTLVATTGVARAERFDYQPWDTFLKAFVTPQGYVDYESIRQRGEESLNHYLASLATVDIRRWPEAERLAFWINAYNALAIHTIVHKPFMRSLDQDFSVLDEPFPLAKGQYSMNDIQHRILRGKTNKKSGLGPIDGVTFKTFDPRIHFALNPGAAGAPKLQNRAFTAENLERLLTAGAVRFANHKKHLRIQDGKLHISSVMKWYKSDFDSVGGAAGYLASLVDNKIRGKDAPKVKSYVLSGFDRATFTFDWTLNDVLNANLDDRFLHDIPK
jgi:hypothetical protein